MRRLPEFEAQARVDELAVRVPEHREQAVSELAALNQQPKEETAIAHRALAWVHLQRHEYDETFEELDDAANLDHADPWTRYYLALAKYDQAANTGNPIQSLPNVMQDLRTVLDWYPDFAEAYNMLAMAQLQGGGVHAATDSIRPAIQLSPRNQSYVMNLARIHLEGKKWDEATALLNRLKDSHDSEIAREAQQDLNDLPMLKKYGVAPEKNTQTTASQPAVVSNNTDDEESSGADETPATSKAPGPDLRKTQFSARQVAERGLLAATRSHRETLQRKPECDSAHRRLPGSFNYRSRSLLLRLEKSSGGSQLQGGRKIRRGFGVDGTAVKSAHNPQI